MNISMCPSITKGFFFKKNYIWITKNELKELESELKVNYKLSMNEWGINYKLFKNELWINHKWTTS